MILSTADVSEKFLQHILFFRIVERFFTVQTALDSSTYSSELQSRALWTEKTLVRRDIITEKSEEDNKSLPQQMGLFYFLLIVIIQYQAVDTRTYNVCNQGTVNIPKPNKNSESQNLECTTCITTVTN